MLARAQWAMPWPELTTMAPAALKGEQARRGALVAGHGHDNRLGADAVGNELLLTVYVDGNASPPQL